jgi:hypothetical protein
MKRLLVLVTLLGGNLHSIAQCPAGATLLAGGSFDFGGLDCSYDVGASQTVSNALEISNGTLTINRLGLLTTDFIVQGPLTINSGASIDVDGSLTIDGGTFTNDGTTTAVLDITVTNGGSFINSGDINTTFGGDIEIDDGSFTTTGGTIDVDDVNIDNGSFTSTGGIIDVDDVNVSATDPTTASIDLSGGTQLNADDVNVSGTGASITLSDSPTNLDASTFNLSDGASGTIGAGSSVDLTGEFFLGNDALTVDGAGTNLDVSGSIIVDGSGFELGTEDIQITNGGNINLNSGGSIASDFINGTQPTDINSISGLTNNGGDLNIGGVELPVELLAFNGFFGDGSVTLYWSTASEINNDYFSVQKSANGIEFYEIGRVQGNGTSNEILTYQFIDYNTSNPVQYYRLHQFDYDGASEILPTIRVGDIELVTSYNMYPNPTYDGRFKVEFGNTLQKQIIVFGSKGEILVNIETTDPIFELNNPLRSGTYIISITTDEVSRTKRLIVK